MDKLNVSVLNNIFENEGMSMSHVAIIGKTGSGKTELMKQIVGSFIESGKKILWFLSDNENDSMIEKWNGYKISNNDEITKEILSSQKLLLFKAEYNDFHKLKNLLMEDSSEWVLVQDNMDEIAFNYEQNEFSTQKLDFLYFISEFGRVFNLYTLISGQDIKGLSAILPTKKILDNTKNLLLLEQSYTSLKYLKKQKWLNDNQIDKVENILKHEAVFFRK